MNSQNIPVTDATVKIKNEDTTLKKRDLIYDSYTCSYDDLTLNQLIESAKSEYKGDLSGASISLTLKIEWEDATSIKKT
jgi:hypothetical protein